MSRIHLKRWFGTVFAAILTLTLIPFGAAYAASEETTVDPSTNGDWLSYIASSTEEVGRIWTDKTVQDGETWEWAEGDYEGETINVSKGSSDFLVSFSALSSTSNVHSTVTVPLDIVLVLDVSGSMADKLEDRAVYNTGDEDGLDKSKTYYYQTGGFNSQVREVQWNQSRQAWGYWSGGRPSTFHSVIPKTSAYDNSSGRVTFYEEVTKMEALQESASAFIGQVAQQNAIISNDSLKHQISVVKFARQIRYVSGGSIGVGNEMIVRQGTDYNYTQPLRNMSICTEAEASALTNMIDDLVAGGGTAAHNALTVAQNQLDRYGRDDAQKIVIFFTDGEPNDPESGNGDGFYNPAANRAIGLAGDMKDDGTTIYTIGVFDGADPDARLETYTDEGKFNTYMHAVSSNYPYAEPTSNESNFNPNMGSRATDSQGSETEYYLAAENAADLSAIFEGIFDEINSSTGSPTHVETGFDMEKTGYITFTDQLGDYMQVDDFKGITYHDEFVEPYAGSLLDPNPSVKTNSDGSQVLTYRFRGEGGNPLDPDANLSQLIVTVERSADLKTGDLVTIKIPASLIPLYSFDVQEEKDQSGASAYTLDSTTMYPGNIFYGVSLKESDDPAKDVRTLLASGEDEQLNAYAAANTVDGKVQFYSNKYSGIVKDERLGETVGDAIAHFVPSKGNPFYYLQEDTPIYVYDSDARQVGDRATSIVEGETYCYVATYYECSSSASNEAEQKQKLVFINDHSFEALQGHVRAGSDGYLYLPVGTPKISFVHELGEAKSENLTETAVMAIDPHWSNPEAPVDIDTHLGNNGVLSIEAPGTLSISKTVEVAEGVDASSVAGKKFGFTVKLSNADGTDFVGSFWAQADGADATKIDLGASDNGTWEFELAHDETVQLLGLPAGTTYVVTEVQADMPAGFDVSDVGSYVDAAYDGVAFSSSIDEGTASGLILAGASSEADFENAYEPAPVTVLGATAFAGAKNFEGRQWAVGDSFSFAIEPLHGDADCPMPEDTDGVADGYVTVTVDYDDAKDIAYNDGATLVPFSFGDVEYTKPGTYEYHIYELDPVTRLPGVTYSLASYEVKVVVTHDAEEGKLVAAASMVMTATDDSVDVIPGDRPSTRAVFTNVFSTEDVNFGIALTKEYANNGDNPLADGMFTFKIDPVGKKSNDGGALVTEADIPMPSEEKGTNVGTSASFLPIKFTTANAGYTYVYKVTEEDSGQPGMDYDDSAYTIEIKVEIADAALVVTPVAVFKGDDPVTEGATLEEQIVFSNSYTPDPVILTGETALKGNKTLVGRDMLEGETFTFGLEAADPFTEAAMGGTNPSVVIAESGDTAAVSGAKDGVAAAFAFGKVTFSKPGTYKFAITENIPDEADRAAGVVYDEHTTIATVVVSEGKDAEGNLTGKLVANVVYTNGVGSGIGSAVTTDAAVFTNRYEVADLTYDGFVLEKTLFGRNMRFGEFEFSVSASNELAEAKLPEALVFANDHARADGMADEMAALEGLVFTKDDAGKTFEFTVSEVIPEDEEKLPGVIYDEAQYKVSISIEDVNGTLVANAAFQKLEGSAWVSVDKVAFANKYEVSPVTFEELEEAAWLTKVLVGRDWSDSDSFTFKISKVSLNGSTNEGDLKLMPLPGNSASGEAIGETSLETTITGASGSAGHGKLDGDDVHFRFVSISFSKPGSYAYKIEEVQPAEKIPGMEYSQNVATITFEVADTGAGELSVSVAAANGTFVNRYASSVDYVAAGGLYVSKTLVGRDMTDGQFGFTVKPEDGASAEKLGIAEQGELVSTPAANDGEEAWASILDGNVVFTHNDIGKVYSLTVKENVPDPKVGGYEYDDAERTVTFEAFAEDSGALKVVTTVTCGTEEKIFEYMTGDANSENPAVVEFVNSYNATTNTDGGTPARIVAEKILSGKDIELHKDDFTFTLVPQPKPEGEAGLTATNDADGSVVFSDIHYDLASLKQAVVDGYATVGTEDGKRTWTLHYAVSEDTDNLPLGISSSASTFNVVVKVVDNGDGTLTATPQYPGESGVEFNNTYSINEPVSMIFAGTKVLKSTSGLNPPDITGKFTFTLEGLDGAPMPEGSVDGKATATNDAMGNVVFDEVVFEADLLEGVNWDTTASPATRTKTFTYRVTESGSVDGVVNDASVKEFKVIVVDTGIGELEAFYHQVGYEHSGPLFIFTNEYKVTPVDSSITDEGQIEIFKNLDGRDLIDGEFEFELYEPASQKVVATGANDEFGVVTFDPVTYYAPGTHSYIVQEATGSEGNGITYDLSTYKVTTVVADNGDGTLSVSHTLTSDSVGDSLQSNEIVFNNTYEAEPTEVVLQLTKRLEGAELKAEQFAFQLLDENGDEVMRSVNAANGEVRFAINDITDTGIYNYTIVEVNDGQENIVYDTTEVKLKIVVVDEGTGSLSAQVEVLEGDLVFENVYDEPLPDTGGEDEGKKPEPGGKDLSQTGDGVFVKVAVIAVLAVAAAGVALMARSRSRAARRTVHRR